MKGKPMAIKLYFFAADGVELATEHNGIDAGSAPGNASYKGRMSDRFGRIFRTWVDGYGDIRSNSGARTLTCADFGGRPVLVKMWSPPGHTMPTEYFWLVPA